MEEQEQVYMVTPQNLLDDVVDGVPVIKVGMHGTQDLSRLKAYGSSARIHQVRTVKKGRGSERVIIALFRARFGEAVYGNEYFRVKVEHATEAFDDCIKLLTKVIKEDDKKAEVSIVNTPPTDKTVYTCNEKPVPFTFCCKTYCHKLCYLHFLHKEWNTNDDFDLKLICVCGKSYDKRKVFFAKKICRIDFYDECIYDFDGTLLDKPIKNPDIDKINILFSELIKSKYDRGDFSDFRGELVERSFNLENYRTWFYPELRSGYNSNTKQEYIIYKTHILCGPYRFGTVTGCHGQIFFGRDEITFSKDLYKNQIQRDTYVILMIDKEATCYGSLFDAGIAIGKGAKVIILFDDNVKFPNPEENKEFNYKEFNYIFTYNYEITENERDMITFIPYLREKYYTYEDYIASLVYYKQKVTSIKKQDSS